MMYPLEGLRGVDLGKTAGNGAMETRKAAERAAINLRQQPAAAGAGVDRELSELTQTVSLLEEAIQAHTLRIQPIILDVPSASGPDSPTPEPSLCHVADRIRDQRRRVRGLTELLTYITSRVDL